MILDTQEPTLKDIVAPGAVERGLYLVDKDEDIGSRVLDRIVDLLWWDSMAVPGVMPSRLGSWMTAPRTKFPGTRDHRRHSRIGALHWIDTGRLFNVGALMSQSRLRGLDAARVARSVRVQYPASVLQYLSALERIPNAALCALGENVRPLAPTAFSRTPVAAPDVRPPSSVWWTPLVVISDLFAPLSDRSIPDHDREDIAHHIHERLEHLTKRAVVIGFMGATNPKDRYMIQSVLKMGVRLVREPNEVHDLSDALRASPSAALH